MSQPLYRTPSQRIRPLLAVVGMALFSTTAAANSVKGTPKVPPIKKVNQDKVSAKIKAQREDIKTCYSKELKKAKASGKLNVSFDIVDGKTREIKVEGLSPTMQTCTKAAIEKWAFPGLTENANGVNINYMLQPGK